jgi:hypothetical protein
VFDQNLYKVYTRIGPTVHYIVLLPLLLQENGDLLQKGVAQPYPNKRGTYKNVFRNRGQSATGSYQQNPTSSAETTTAITNYGQHRSYGHQNYYTNPTSTTSRNAARSKSPGYDVPTLYTFNGEQYVHFQGKVYPYKTWQEHERRVLGSSDT